MGIRAKATTLAIWQAQGKNCSLCGTKMVPAHMAHRTRGWSWDHVWPRSRFAYFGEGNLLIAHVACNNAKGDRRPTGCEVLLLTAVNARLGLELTEKQHSYRDEVAAPSVLALKLHAALAA